MLRILIIFILFLVVFAGIVLFLMQETGFAIFNYGDLSIEIPLVNFAIGLFVIFTFLYVLFKLFSFLFNAPGRIQSATTHRKQNKALNNTKEGLTKYILGDWINSEKLLLRGAINSDKACVNYFWAARAAHYSGNYEARDEYLGKAKDCTPDAQAALNVLQAELLLDQDLPEQALASLSQQISDIRTNTKIAKLVALAYLRLNNWEKLSTLLPELKSSKGLDRHTIENIKKQTALGLLNLCKQKNSSIQVENISAQFEDIILCNDELTVAYVEALRTDGKYDMANSLITKIIDQNWNSELIRQYGLLHFKDPSKALIKAEKWVEHHTDDANLYLTLGRLCKHAQLWGKAKAYFESSLSRKPLAETYAELAALHKQLNEVEEAHRCTQKGLRLATKVV